MINNIKKPDISPNFTIEDIHKIRAYHYELYKEMGEKKFMEYMDKKATELHELIQARREARKKKVISSKF